MSTIIEQFGGVILAMIAGILVIGILFGIARNDQEGILGVLGEATEKQEEVYADYEDYDAVITWHEREVPSVSYEETKGRYFAEQSTPFLSRYYVKDMEEQIYSLDKVIIEELYQDVMFGQILDIRNSDGESVMAGYSEIDGSMTFAQAGIYEVYFTVRDRENVTSTWKIPIVVDERIS